MSQAWVSVCLVFVFAACSGGGGGGHPGDRFFRGVVAGDTTSGSFNMALFDPEMASKREPGKPGSDPTKQEVWGEYRSKDGSETATLSGTWQGDSFTASGGGWKFEGKTDGAELEADVTGPNGEQAKAAGIDIFEGKVGTFCGTYSGAMSGTWNFAISESGSLVGSFAGGASGSLSGSGDGNNVSMHWNAPEEDASGSAKGTIDEGGQIQGTWSGNSDWGKVSGTWQSTGTCASAEEDPWQSQSLTLNCCGGTGDVRVCVC